MAKKLELNEKLKLLETTVQDEILEREHEIHTAVLALIGRQHHFSVGPPGLAKSLLVERIADRIEGMNYFRWLLTKFTNPEEIFGGFDLLHLKKTGEPRRITRDKLPTAHVVFLDEIFKGSSPILNALLTAMNERLFPNPGHDPHIPLNTIFGASNELPAGDELGAMWDRLHFRHVTEPLGSASAFGQMLVANLEENPDKILTLDDLNNANKQLKKVKVTPEIIDSIQELRSVLRTDNIVVTDRRWKESMTVIRAEAWLQGHDEVDIDDCRPLVHVLWSDDSQRRAVLNHVLSMINPLDRKAVELWEVLREMEHEMDKIISESDNDRVKLQKTMECVQKIKRMRSDYDEINQSKRHTEYTIQAKKKYVDFTRYLQSKLENLKTNGKT